MASPDVVARTPLQTRTATTTVGTIIEAAISLELWVASLQAVQMIARYRCDGVTGEPPDLHPGAIALVQRCAPQWSAERTVSETVVRARLDLARLTGRA